MKHWYILDILQLCEQLANVGGILHSPAFFPLQTRRIFSKCFKRGLNFMNWPGSFERWWRGSVCLARNLSCLQYTYAYKCRDVFLHSRKRGLSLPLRKTHQAGPLLVVELIIVDWRDFTFGVVLLTGDRTELSSLTGSTGCKARIEQQFYKSHVHLANTADAGVFVIRKLAFVGLWRTCSS